MFTLSKNPHGFSHAKTADQCKQNARHKGQTRVSQSERSTRLFIIMNEKRYTRKFCRQHGRKVTWIILNRGDLPRIMSNKTTFWTL